MFFPENQVVSQNRHQIWQVGCFLPGPCVSCLHRYFVALAQSPPFFKQALNTLDAETDYMMYEPNERTQTTNVQELKNDIENNVICGSDFLQVAMENQKMVGYIRAERGKFNRILHTAYIVVGILKDYRGKGIGTSFFEMLNCWAKENGIKRLELTVECCNETARHLYEKSGFKIEGTREKSMFVNGSFVDEFYMAKIL